jgi:hypothetical protein
MRKHLVILTDVVSGSFTFSEAPRLAQSVVLVEVTILLGLYNPRHRGCGEPAKPGLLYPLVWISCCGIEFAGVAKESRLHNNWFGFLGNML